MFSWSKIKKPVFVLAPMANITTLPFRAICKQMGADIVFTPMISSNAVVHNPNHALHIAEFLPEEQPIIVQVFGYNGELISKAANIIDQKIHPAGIDINLGCPAPKITGNECGSALLKDLPKAILLLEQIRDNFNGQLSVKLRLGWKDCDILKPMPGSKKSFVQHLEKIGIDAVSIHGRTAKQGYRGKANCEAIESIASQVKIPIIGNGDIDNWEIAIEKSKAGKVAGIMIGRATLGNPWIFKEIKKQKGVTPSQKEVVDIIHKQAGLYIKYAGEQRAMLEMRKHLCWYLKGFPGALELRKKAVLIKTEEGLGDLIKSVLEQ